MSSTPSKEYSIGQVVYILSNRSQTILPGIVYGETTNKTINGTEIAYKLAVGPSNGRKIVDLTKVDGQLFGSLDEIRDYMIEKFSEFVDDLCLQTKDKADKWYGSPENITENVNTDAKIDPAALLHEVNNSGNNNRPIQQPNNNGQPNLVSIQGNRAVPMQQQQPMTPHQTLRNRIADPSLNERDVVMPDGSVQKVSINLNPKN